jgi:hypothetical protein
MHPFQPFIIGQKTFAVKLADKFNIPLVFYGENGGKGGKKISHTVKSFKETKNQEGFELDPLKGQRFENVFIGGKKVQEYINSEFSNKASYLTLPTKEKDPADIIKAGNKLQLTNFLNLK